VLFGHAVSETLATEIVDPALFVTTPVVIDWNGFSAVGLWSVVANCHGAGVCPHAVVGAIAGCWVAVGVQAIDWSSIRIITLAWL